MSDTGELSKRYVESLFFDVDEARARVIDAVSHCKATGKITEACLEKCPILMVDETTYDEEKVIIRERAMGLTGKPATSAINLKNNIVRNTAGWITSIERIETQGCVDGPREFPSAWSSDPADKFSYICSTLNPLEQDDQ